MADFIDKLGDLFGGDHVGTNHRRGHLCCFLWFEDADPEDPEGTEEGIYDIYTPNWYANDGTLVREEERPCGRCGLTAEINGPDPCLGMLEGVSGACCGHGEVLPIAEVAPYVAFGERGVDGVLRGLDALRYFADKGVGPDPATASTGTVAS